MAVVLADLLQPDQVELELPSENHEAALRAIVARMSGLGQLRDGEKFLQEVMARENSTSTFMGHGVAFPHARTDLVDEIVLGIGRSTAGIPFGPEGERAHFLFVIAVPRRMVTDYLVCVGALARIVGDGARRAALREATSVEEFLEILRASSRLLE